MSVPSSPNGRPPHPSRPSPAARRPRHVHGWLVVDKPPSVTSMEVVRQVKRAFNAKKVGHAGTLDPLATGVLPIAMGEALKTMAYVIDHRKHYTFTVRWGQARDTDDAQGAVVAESDHRPTNAAIQAALPAFCGQIDQRPPAYSAIKVHGKRSYDMARAGAPPDLAPRPVQVDRFELIDMPDQDHARFFVLSHAGVYMRALARDLALALGTVGHVTALQRSQVGTLGLDDAVSLAHIKESQGHFEVLDKALMPVHAPLQGMPVVDLDHKQAHVLRSGGRVSFLRRADLERLQCLAVASSSEVLSDACAPRQEQTRREKVQGTRQNNVQGHVQPGHAQKGHRQGSQETIQGDILPSFEGTVLATHRGAPLAIAHLVGGEMKAKRVFAPGITP
ncbi:MAG: tRNA pseudouridine(55) synthase TruB [Pseudomonadota bacterium]